jgi:hypothetical protein
MAYWLKLIGTIDNPIDEYSKSYVDYSPHGYDYIADGDKIILYATGRGIVFATADVVSQPRPSDTQWPFRVDVDYRCQPVPVAEGVHVNLIEDDGHDSLRQEIKHQSFVPISESEFNRTETLLGED